ncbi:hypothetical protein RAD16_11565 [Bradyrhizobium sp. 18BD]
MAPTLAQIRTLARSKTEAAINVLAAIMFRETANAFARVAAANALLAWGWGKPVQPLAADEGPLEMIHRIERVIVHPNQPPALTNEINDREALQAPQAAAPLEKVLR